MRMRGIVRFGVLLVLCACDLVGGSRSESPPAVAVAPKAPASTAPPLRVLFVGNSHTYYNDMPGTIGKLAEAARERPLQAALVTAGGASLQTHLAGTEVKQRLRERWDMVVLQEQQQRPSFVNLTQVEDEFFGPARTLDVLIKTAGAKTVLYMTAARRDGDRDNVLSDTFEAMQGRVSERYLSLGRELGALVAPVGLAYRDVHERHPSIPLWVQDGSHPTPQGSYLAACVFFRLLYDRSPEGNTYLGNLQSAEATVLQRAAAQAQTPPGP